MRKWQSREKAANVPHPVHVFAVSFSVKYDWRFQHLLKRKKEVQKREIKIEKNLPSRASPSLSSSSSSSSQRFLGDHVILFSFFSRRLALANHVETWVNVIFVIIASMIFSPLVGYGFLRCSFSHAFRVEVVSRVAFLRRAPFKSMPYLFLITK